MSDNTRYGSAHNGLNEWYFQRLSAVGIGLLMPVVFVFLVAVYDGSLNQMQLLALLDSHIGRILHTLFLSALLLHAYLGIKVMLEDYVHQVALRIVLMGVVLLGTGISAVWWLSLIWARGG
ncbi:MAG: succinate dehydrogenase, hydrophobic membrane anchor protein [Mariprofundaceae bacterium]